MVIHGPLSAFESETFGQDASFHLEQPIGSMSISPSGRDVVLASKEGLHIIDLDSPYSPPRYLPHRTPWEVADVQWSPFAQRDYWVVSTSNQKALVWNLEAKTWQDSIEFVLHGHRRAITDINFSGHNPDILATCAVDSFVHCWDLRIPLRPAFSFSDWFAGATQVKWSRQDAHIVASSHDRYLHVWDDRHGARPLRTIAAHGTKIYGLDWNRFETSKIVTCSLDKTIKFWDLDKPEDVPDRIIETPFPVWRARHTPFGWGLLAMPQRGSNELHVYDRRPVDGVLESGPIAPVASFTGHEGQVKEFLWRARGTIVDQIDHRDFQLVSWGTDRELRLHRLEPDTFAGIGYTKGETSAQGLLFTRRGAKYKTFRDEPDETNSPIDNNSNPDSTPSSSHFLHVRPRTSTTVGMNKVPVAQFRGWVEGGRRANRTGMHGKSSIQNTIDPVSWLKHVKIPSWESDTIAEEIRHVGEKFKRVEFEVVDIRRRKAVMSLQAPWGDHQTPLYLRIDMRFPKTYPRGSSAIITLQKSSTLLDNMYKILSTEMQTIAETYASRQRGCLEAILRYILREQSMEQIVAWILGESLGESKILDPETLPVDDSSSDDDEQLEGLPSVVDASANARVPLAKGCGALWAENGKLICFFPPPSNEPSTFSSTLRSRNLEDSHSNKLFEGFGRLHASSPARKATNGTRTIEEESDSETSDSLLGSSSSSSASSDPEANIHASVLPYPAGVTTLQQPPRSLDRSNYSTTLGGRKLANDRRVTYVSIHDFEDLLPSKKSLATEYSIRGNPAEVCRFNAEVAAKSSREDLGLIWTLAGLILSEKPNQIQPVSKQNDKLARMISAKTAISELTKNPSIRVDLGKTLQNHVVQGVVTWGDSPFGSSYLIPAMFEYFDRIGDIQMLAMLAYIFTTSTNSSHAKKPEASQSQPIHSNSSNRLANAHSSSNLAAETTFNPQISAQAHIRSRSFADSRSGKPLSGNDSQAFSRQQKSVNPYDKSVSAKPNRQLERSSSFRTSSITGDDSGERSSLASAAVSVSTSPEGARLSQRNQTNIAYASAKASLSALTQSYSNSPPTNASASMVASSLKKYSPSGSLTPAWASSGIFSSSLSSRNSKVSLRQLEVANEYQSSGMRTSQSLVNLRGSNRGGRVPSAKGGRRPETSRSTSNVTIKTQRQKLSGKRKILKSSLHNHESFALDNTAQVPLVDSRIEWKLQSYRLSYAQMLENWQLYIQRAEILANDQIKRKISGDEKKRSLSNIDDRNIDQILLSQAQRRNKVSNDADARLALDIKRCCRKCGDALDPIQRNGIPIGWHCINATCASGSRKIPIRSICVVCCKSIRALAVPCLQCGHMTCYDCAEGWFGPWSTADSVIRRSSSSESKRSTVDDEDSNDQEKLITNPRPCPTGCGCICPTFTAISTSDTSVEVKDKSPQTLILPLSPAKGDFKVTRSKRLMSQNGPDTALGAFLALTRTRSRTVKDSIDMIDPTDTRSEELTNDGSSAVGESSSTQTSEDDDDEAEVEDEQDLNPWVGSRIASLGRGVGSGLSRGLRSKASDSTIRRISEL